MSISTSQAQTSFKKIYENASSLNSNSIISMFEIDIDQISTDAGLILGDNDLKIFRFHNNLKLTNNKIIFQGKTFIAAPIKAEGFMITSKGTLPTPKLALSVDANGIEFLDAFKSKLRVLGDLVGAKVTRIRTFMKYLDIENWASDQVPDGIEPDPYAEFPRDIYYIDRKSQENKFSLEFELASILDVEGIKLPARVVYAKRCSWQYRGHGCCYEYEQRQNDDIHEDAILPSAAPPVATDRDEKISTIIGGIGIRDPENYDANKLSQYIIGSSVFITKNGINYYFVSKVNAPTAGPPHSGFWVQDNCSKSLIGCRKRWGVDGSVNVAHTDLVKGNLPFGGFAAADKVG